MNSFHNLRYSKQSYDSVAKTYKCKVWCTKCDVTGIANIPDAQIRTGNVTVRDLSKALNEPCKHSSRSQTTEKA